MCCDKRFLRMVSDPTRLEILCLLRQGETCACEMMPLLNKSQPTISLHLSILAREGIITGRKVGRKVLFSISDDRILNIMEIIRSEDYYEKAISD